MTEERPHPLTPLVKAWVALVAFAWFAIQTLIDQPDIFQSFDFSRLPWWAIPVLVLLVFSGLMELWQWWTTRFVVTDTELRVDHRGLTHESKRIAYSRIQSVDLKQKFAARILGMAELTIDVGADSSTTLTYLGRQRAVELREHLMRRAQDARVTPPQVGEGEGFDSALPASLNQGDAPAALNQQEPGDASLSQRQPHDTTNIWTDLAASDRVIVRLTPPDLIVGALASLWFWILLLWALGALGAALWFHEPLASWGLLPAALGLVGYVSTQVVNNFNFALAETPTGLKITRGLTTLSTQSVPLARVQAITIEQPLGWRLIKRYRVRLSVLGGLDLSGDEASVLLPVGTRAQALSAVRAVWPWLDLEAISLIRPPKRARWIAPLAFSWIAHGCDERVLFARDGFFVRSETVVPHARIQSAELSQGPVRRWARVASVQVHPAGMNADGLVRLIDATLARTFIDLVLQRASSHR